MTELAPRSHDDVEPAPITDLLDFPVEKFWPVLRRFTTPAASAHFIELVLTPPPNTPAPYGQTRFTFTLDFSEPGSAPPEAERLFSLFLPSTVPDMDAHPLIRANHVVPLRQPGTICDRQRLPLTHKTNPQG